VKEGLFSSAFRRTFCGNVDRLQADLNRYLEFYIRQRAHQGYRKRRTPFQDTDLFATWSLFQRR
jgi:hypothetical protein